MRCHLLRESGKESFLLLAPIKVEVLSQEPMPGLKNSLDFSLSLFFGISLVYIFHDIVSKAEAALMMRTARNNVMIF